MNVSEADQHLFKLNPPCSELPRAEDVLNTTATEMHGPSQMDQRTDQRSTEPCTLIEATTEERLDFSEIDRCNMKEVDASSVVAPNEIDVDLPQHELQNNTINNPFDHPRAVDHIFGGYGISPTFEDLSENVDFSFVEPVNFSVAPRLRVRRESLLPSCSTVPERKSASLKIEPASVKPAQVGSMNRPVDVYEFKDDECYVPWRKSPRIAAQGRRTTSKKKSAKKKPSPPLRPSLPRLSKGSPMAINGITKFGQKAVKGVTKCGPKAIDGVTKGGQTAVSGVITRRQFKLQNQPPFLSIKREELIAFPDTPRKKKRGFVNKRNDKPFSKGISARSSKADPLRTGVRRSSPKVESTKPEVLSEQTLVQHPPVSPTGCKTEPMPLSPPPPLSDIGADEGSNLTSSQRPCSSGDFIRTMERSQSILNLSNLILTNVLEVELGRFAAEPFEGRQEVLELMKVNLCELLRKHIAWAETVERNRIEIERRFDEINQVGVEVSAGFATVLEMIKSLTNVQRDARVTSNVRWHDPRTYSRARKRLVELLEENYPHPPV